jgi:ArsR family transcriptional regulator
MDKNIYELHAEFCKVFTSPVRIEILDLLRDGKKTVSELVELTGLNQPNISQHLHVMKEKNIVRTEKQGSNVFYSLANPRISKAFGIMKEILKEQLSESEKMYKTIAKEERSIKL